MHSLAAPRLHDAKGEWMRRLAGTNVDAATHKSLHGNLEAVPEGAQHVLGRHTNVF